MKDQVHDNLNWGNSDYNLCSTGCDIFIGPNLTAVKLRILISSFWNRAENEEYCIRKCTLQCHTFTISQTTPPTHHSVFASFVNDNNGVGKGAVMNKSSDLYTQQHTSFLSIHNIV